MTELRRLYKDSSHYLLGQVGIFLVGFVSFPVFTRVFSVPEYGLMSLALNTVALAAVFSKLGLQHSLVRFYPEYAHSADPDAKRRYYSTLFWSASSIATLMTLLFVVGVWVAPAGWVSAPVKRLLLFASVLIFVRAVSSIVMNLWRTEGKTKLYSLVNVGTKAATVATILLLLFTWQRSLKAFFAGMIAVEAAVMVGVVLLVWWRRRLVGFGLLDNTFLRHTIAFGLPMVGFELSSLILDNGDRFLVQHFLGAQQLGYYVAAYNLASYVQEAVAAPLNLAMYPIYMNLWVTKGEAETKKFLSEGLEHFVMLAIGIVACVTVTGRDGIVFLSTKKYQEASHLLPLLVASLLIYSLGIYLNAGLLIHKKTFTMARFVFYSSVLNMLLNVLLIPRMHLMGAAVATLVACVFLAAMMGSESLSLLPLRFDFGVLAKSVLGALAAAFAASRLNFDSALLNLVSKGLLFAALYGGLLWMTNPKVRSLAVALIGRNLKPVTPGGVPVANDGGTAH